MKRLNLLDKKAISLIKEITIAEFKVRDQSKVFGFFWTLIYPLFMFLITYFIFLRWSGKYITKFAPYLLVGIVQWNYFLNATNAAMSIILRRRGYIRSFNFPYEILILSSTICSLIIHIIEVGLLIFILFYINNGLTGAVFLLPIFIIIETLLILGVSFTLSALHIFFRDIDYIWTVILRLSIFITPIFYSLEMLTRKQKVLLMINPLTYILNITRSILVYKTNPGITDIIVAVSFTLVIFGAGYKIFKRLSGKFSEFV